MKTRAIHIDIPGEPAAKGRPRMTRTGHAFTPKKTAAYENLVKLHAGIAMDGRNPIEGPVKVTVYARFPIPASWSIKKRLDAELGYIPAAKRPDLDNIIKSATDGCNEIVYRDDSQIVELTAAKMYAARTGLTIIVEPIHVSGGENETRP